MQEAFAGNIVSALFMAGAAYQIFRFLEEVWQSAAGCAGVLTATFALHPMIVLYAVNSMSEAMFIFFLLLVAASCTAGCGRGRCRRWSARASTSP